VFLPIEKWFKQIIHYTMVD